VDSTGDGPVVLRGRPIKVSCPGNLRSYVLGQETVGHAALGISGRLRLILRVILVRVYRHVSGCSLEGRRAAVVPAQRAFYVAGCTPKRPGK